MVTYDGRDLVVLDAAWTRLIDCFSLVLDYMSAGCPHISPCMYDATPQNVYHEHGTRVCPKNEGCVGVAV